jgi:hypothetical protein
LSLLALPTLSMSQDEGFSSKTKSYGIGGHLISNGVGLSYHQQKYAQKRFDRFFYADFGSFKHTNEAKVVNHKVENKMPYVYGKLFHTANAKALAGLSIAVTRPNLQNGVAIDIQGGVGFSIGIQRPVYLRIETIENDQKTVKNVKYSPSSVSNAEPIIGYSRNGQGWRELEYRPGLVARFNVAFTWDEFAQVAKRVYVGTSLNYFPNGLPIMAFGQNPKLNPTFFAGFMWVVNQG